MGRRVTALARADRRFYVAALIDKKSAGGCLGTAGFLKALEAADIAVDFSSPACAVSCASAAAKLKKRTADRAVLTAVFFEGPVFGTELRVFWLGGIKFSSANSGSTSFSGKAAGCGSGCQAEWRQCYHSGKG